MTAGSVGADLDAIGERPEYDPSYAAVQGAFTATLNQYLRSELGVQTDAEYEILTPKVQPWDYGQARNRYVNVGPILRSAMTKNTTCGSSSPTGITTWRRRLRRPITRSPTSGWTRRCVGTSRRPITRPDT